MYALAFGRIDPVGDPLVLREGILIGIRPSLLGAHRVWFTDEFFERTPSMFTVEDCGQIECDGWHFVKLDLHPVLQAVWRLVHYDAERNLIMAIGPD